MRKVNGFLGKCEVVKNRVKAKIDVTVSNAKENLLLVGSGITAISVLFVIASVFVETLGLYVAMIIGFTVVTEFMQLVTDNRKAGE